MTRAVIFDIDNTLYNYDNCHRVAWDALCEYVRVHLQVDREQFAAYHKEAAKAVERRLGIDCGALHNRLLRYQVLLEMHGFGLAHALPMEKIYWDTLIAAMEPAPGIMECLPALKKAGYVLGIGTDMTVDYQLLKLEAMKMMDYFDFIVSSEEVAAEKPAVKLFRCCAEKAGVPAAECVFIGDNFKKDILGAQAAGMTPIWFCEDAQKAAEHPETMRITHFDQLRGQLTKAGDGSACGFGEE